MRASWWGRKRYCVMVAQQTLTLFVWVQILVPLPKMGPGPEVAQALFFMKKPPRKRRHIFEVWLSLVERYVRDVEAAGSNPVTSTMFTHLKRCHTEKAPEFRGFLAFKRPSNALCAYAPTTVTA